MAGYWAALTALAAVLAACVVAAAAEHRRPGTRRAGVYDPGDPWSVFLADCDMAFELSGYAAGTHVVLSQGRWRLRNRFRSRGWKDRLFREVLFRVEAQAAAAGMRTVVPGRLFEADFGQWGLEVLVEKERDTGLPSVVLLAERYDSRGNVVWRDCVALLLVCRERLTVLSRAVQLAVDGGTFDEVEKVVSGSVGGG